MTDAPWRSRAKTIQRRLIIGDRVASIKETYEKHGPGRTNMAYGYVAKPV